MEISWVKNTDQVAFGVTLCWTTCHIWLVKFINCFGLTIIMILFVKVHYISFKSVN